MDDGIDNLDDEDIEPPRARWHRLLMKAVEERYPQFSKLPEVARAGFSKAELLKQRGKQGDQTYRQQLGSWLNAKSTALPDGPEHSRLMQVLIPSSEETADTRNTLREAYLAAWGSTIQPPTTHASRVARSPREARASADISVGNAPASTFSMPEMVAKINAELNRNIDNPQNALTPQELLKYCRLTYWHRRGGGNEVLTQEKAAEMIGVSHSAWFRWESSKNDALPEKDSLSKLQEHFFQARDEKLATRYEQLVIPVRLKYMISALEGNNRQAFSQCLTNMPDTFSKAMALAFLQQTESKSYPLAIVASAGLYMQLLRDVFSLTPEACAQDMGKQGNDISATIIEALEKDDKTTSKAAQKKYLDYLEREACKIPEFAPYFTDASFTLANRERVLALCFAQQGPGTGR